MTLHCSEDSADHGLGLYDARPWLAHYPPGRAAHVHIDHGTPLSMLAATVSARPDDTALAYFGSTMTWSELDRATDTVAALLISRDFRPGDRMAIILQNNPAFVIALIAAWKAGGIAAVISPVSTSDELVARLRDYEPTALIALDDVYVDKLRGPLLREDLGVRVVLTASALDGVDKPDPRLFAGVRRCGVADTISVRAIVEQVDFSTPARRPNGPRDTAVLLATSGTTGPPKGARLTHANLTFSAQTYYEWTAMSGAAPILAASPLFHVTGLIGGAMLSILSGAPLVLTHRFHPEVIADAIRYWKPGFTVAVITAFIALADESSITPEEMRCLRYCLSGGAPIDPDVAERLSERLGGRIQNVYGLTESTSPTHMIPPNVVAPVDEETGVMSVGLPVFDTVVRVVDDAGRDVPVGEIGQFVVTGPQVCDGYWRNPEATAEVFVGAELRTGDVGFMDRDGWFYVIDRQSEIINASGYKVWPTEVERVLCGHPAVIDAAVVGIPDDYRGESVKAFVVLTAPDAVTESALIDYARERLAAFKYPREIDLVGELPRTATGKLMRRELR